jgi:hypothetical protein
MEVAREAPQNRGDHPLDSSFALKESYHLLKLARRTRVQGVRLDDLCRLRRGEKDA